MMHSFRGDIAGYRALAVIGVFLFHVDAEAFNNSYLGVDLFLLLADT